MGITYYAGRYRQRGIRLLGLTQNDTVLQQKLRGKVQWLHVPVSRWQVGSSPCSFVPFNQCEAKSEGILTNVWLIVRRNNSTSSSDRGQEYGSLKGVINNYDFLYDQYHLRSMSTLIKKKYEHLASMNKRKISLN